MNMVNLKCQHPDCKSSEKFISSRTLIYHIKNDHKLSIEEYSIAYLKYKKNKCLYCDEMVSWNNRKYKFNLTCGNRSCRSKIASKKSRQSVKEKYGVNSVFALEKTKSKTAKTKLEKYGNATYNNSKKNKETCLAKYGVDNVSKTEEVRKKLRDNYNSLDKIEIIEKIKRTWQEKYGVDWNSQNPEIIDKAMKSLKKTRKKELLVRIREMNLEIKKEYSNENMDLFCIKCQNPINNISRSRINYHYRNKNSPCLTCFPQNRYRSNAEKELLDIIREIYDGPIDSNRKYLGSEMDLILPNEKLCIEYNGLYWHSSLYKSKKYHWEKKEMALKKGYNLIHIWEDDWNNPIKKMIIIFRIKNILGLSKKIYARKTILKEISINDYRKFTNENHLMGYAAASIKIGLFYQEELVSVSSFSKGRASIGKNNGDWELIRNCTKMGYSVVGGFSKMLKYFRINYKGSIFSYADLDWTNPNSSAYEKNGFRKIRYTSPTYYWVIKGKRKHRSGYQKHKLIQMGANPKYSETEIMENMGYYKVYNAGNILYEYREKE